MMKPIDPNMTPEEFDALSDEEKQAIADAIIEFGKGLQAAFIPVIEGLQVFFNQMTDAMRPVFSALSDLAETAEFKAYMRDMIYAKDFGLTPDEVTKVDVFERELHYITKQREQDE